MGRHTKKVVVFSDRSIDSAIKYLERYKAAMLAEFDTQVERLANNAADVARQSVASDTTVSVERTGNVWVITASGKSIPFIEFGSGVFYNGDGSSYPLPRPEGIVGIGEYGQGHGKQKSWVYYDTKEGKLKSTRGVRMRMPMAKASESVHYGMRTMKFKGGKI